MVKKKLHALAKNKALIGVVIVVVLVILYFKIGKVSVSPWAGTVQEEGTPSSEVTEQEQAPPQEELSTALSTTAGCTDTDGGKNYKVKGEVSDVEGAHDIDRCSKSDVYTGRLYEAYCADDGTHERDVYDCPSGVCEDGACA